MSTSMPGKEYRDGEVIIRQGEIGDCMYLIQEGAVEVIQRHGGKEFCFALLGPGDFFGEMALIEKDVRVATIRAVGRACVLSIEKRAFLNRMHEDASYMFRLIKSLSERIRRLEAMLVRSTDISMIQAALLAADRRATQPMNAKIAVERELKKG